MRTMSGKPVTASALRSIGCPFSGKESRCLLAYCPPASLNCPMRAVRQASTADVQGCLNGLPCVVPAEGEFFALVVHKDAVLHPDEGVGSLQQDGAISTFHLQLPRQPYHGMNRPSSCMRRRSLSHRLRGLPRPLIMRATGYDLAPTMGV